MGKRTNRGQNVSGNQVQGSNAGRNSGDCVQPDHRQSAFGIEEPACYIIHRIGPGKEYEKLYGPYLDKEKARRRVAEYAEHFIRENKRFNPRMVHRDFEYAKIDLHGMSAKGEGPAKASFYFVIKPVTA